MQSLPGAAPHQFAPTSGSEEMAAFGLVKVGERT